MKLRAFWNELQSTGFRYCFSEALLILQPPLGGVSLSDLHLQPPVTLWSIQKHFAWAGLSGSAFLPCSALTRWVCRRTEPIPSFQGRPDHNPAKINSPFLQRSADSVLPPWGENKQREKLERKHLATCVPLDLLAAS